MNKRFSTAEIPAEFLKATYHVGHIPLRVLSTEPRIQYALYVPPEHYSVGSHGPLSDEKPVATAKLPLLVYVHGTTRNYSAIYTSFKTFADAAPCAVLAPVFPAGLEGPNDLDSYKKLHSTHFRFDLLMLSLLDEVAEVWPGIDTAKIFLSGFSGGGQFAHRFFYLHPERLAAVSVGAPGFVTLLDEKQNWPRGVGDVSILFEKSIDRSLLKSVKVQLVIGSNDNQPYGSPEFWVWIRQVLGTPKSESTGQIDGEHTDESNPSFVERKNRIESIQQLRDSWEAIGIECQLDMVDGVSHHFDGIVEHVVKFMRPLIQKR